MSSATPFAVPFAVIPAAGLGTRFLPVTKTLPKEMLPIVDKPLVAYAVEEACRAGVRTLVFITSRGKRALEDYFDPQSQLEQELAAAGEDELLRVLQETIPRSANLVFVRQPAPHGLGHAVGCAAQVVRDSAFAVLLPDELMLSEPGQDNALAQLLTCHSHTGRDCVGVLEIPAQDTSKYGIVAPGATLAERCVEVRDMVEKPTPGQAPSTLAAVGRYVFGTGFMAELAQLQPGARGELQLTDAIARRARQGRVAARHLDCQRFDCGSKLGYLQANVAVGCAHPELGPGMAHWLKSQCA